MVAPAQHNHAGDWLRRHKDMSPAERQRALENDPGFRRLPPAQQQVLRQRLQHFSSLPPEQQERMLDRMDRWAHLTPEQKEQARQIHSRMQQLPPDRQRMVRTAVGDLRAMPPGQREQIIDSNRFRGMFSPEERDIMRGATRLPLAPPENGRPEEPPPTELVRRFGSRSQFPVSRIRSVKIVRNGFGFRDEQGLHTFRFH